MILRLLCYILFGFALTSCSSTIRYCGPDKTQPVRIYKKPNNHFSQVSKNLNIVLKGNLDLINKLSIKNLNVDVKTDTKLLAQELNNTSLRLNDILFRAAEAYNSNPCPTENSKRFYDVLDIATKELENLSKLEVNLKSLVESANLDGVDENSLVKAISEYRENVPNM